MDALHTNQFPAGNLDRCLKNLQVELDHFIRGTRTRVLHGNADPQLCPGFDVGLLPVQFSVGKGVVRKPVAKGYRGLRSWNLPVCDTVGATLIFFEILQLAKIEAPQSNSYSRPKKGQYRKMPAVTTAIIIKHQGRATLKKSSWEK